MTKKLKLSLIVSFYLLFVFLLAAPALAQTQLEINYPEIAGFKPEAITKDILPNYIKYIFNFAVAASGLVVLAVLIYAGFLYMTSGGSASKMQAAKEKIGRAALGLAILLGSYLILTAVNPQLTFINLPELAKIALVSPESATPATRPTLSAQEIPIGVLIEQNVNAEKEDKSKKEEGVFAKTRIQRIEEIYKKVGENTELLKTLSESLKTLGEDLKKMTDSCSCQRTNPYTQSCGYDPSGASCPVKDLGSCRNDPCLNRPGILAKNKEINLKRKEIFVRLYSGAGEKTAIDQPMKDLYFSGGEQELKAILKAESGDYDLGLLYWQQSLDYEMKDLQRVSGVFLDAQNKINRCPNTAGFKATALLNYYDFVRYKEIINTKAKYEKIQIQAWPNAVPSQDNATFYCVEQEVGAGMVLGLPAEEAKKQIISPESWNIKEPEVRCSAEITLGNMFEKSNDLVQKILLEMQNLFQKNDTLIKTTDSILKIEDLEIFIAEISNYNCASGCYSWKVEKCQPGEEDAPPVCWWEYYCKVAPNPCQGVPGTKKISNPIGDIAGRTPQFSNLFEVIKNTQEEITKVNIPNLLALIEKTKEITDKDPKKNSDELEQNRIKLTDSFCSNSKIEWEGFLAGSSISEKGFYSCSEAQAMGWKSNCENKNNYVCCQSKTQR